MLKRLFSSVKRPYIPGINSLEQFTMDLSGNTLSFKLPPHQNFQGFEERITHELNPDIYNNQAYEADPYNLFSQRILLSRRLELFGVPWDTQPIGSIGTGILIFRADSLPKEMSCLAPRHFEQVILRFLFNHGPENPQYGVRVAPVNWQVFNTHDTPWIYYEERDKKHSDEVAWKSFACAPLDDRLFVLANFHCINSDQKEIINEHFRSIMSRVVSTFNLTYSPEIQAKLQRLKGSTKESTYSDHREPENWVYPWAWHRGSVEHGEPPIVVTDSGTPAPEYTK